MLNFRSLNYWIKSWHLRFFFHWINCVKIVSARVHPVWSWNFALINKGYIFGYYFSKTGWYPKVYRRLVSHSEHSSGTVWIIKYFDLVMWVIEWPKNDSIWIFTTEIIFEYPWTSGHFHDVSYCSIRSS